MFENVDAYPGDPILGLNEEFHRDLRAEKVNLSIGIYFDADGNLPLMSAVRDAERSLLERSSPRPYLPISGNLDYRQRIQELVFGVEHPARKDGRIVTLQTLGGSGALKVGADFLKLCFPKSSVWVSDPTWDNHQMVFERAGLGVHAYPYYDSESGGLRFDDMCATIRSLPPRSGVLLHACCHNPTGVDLTPAQWEALTPILLERDLIAFVDRAYQGFGGGLDEDAAAVQALAAAGVCCVVANSLSKNFSMYGERCGGLSIVCESEHEAQRVLTQLMATVRSNYSNPPTHGAQVAANILGSPVLRMKWETELASMRERIATMRRAIHSALKDHVEERRLSRYLTHRGMFTYTGLDAAQVDQLRSEYGVYLLRSGRMCIAGLNESNLPVVVRAFAGVLTL